MELVDRYLNAVRFWLPKVRQEDILAELSEDIRSQIDEKEAELGRKVNEADVEAILQHWGNPMLVAEQYRPQRQLIGRLFLEYWLTLRMVLGITAVVLTIVFVAVLASGKPLPKAFLLFPVILFAEFGYVTVLYAVRERFYRPENWNPRSLPRITEQAEEKRSPSSAYGVAIYAFYCLWWLTGLRIPYLIFGPLFKFTDVWQALYVPIVVVSLAELGRQILRLIRPEWTKFLSVTRLVINGAGLAICYFLLRAGDLVEVTEAAKNWGGMTTQAWWIVGISVTWSLYLDVIISGIVSALTVLSELWQLVRPTHRQVTSRA